MGYTTNDVKTLLNVAPETVRNWTREFARYLSATANPEAGRTRLYTDDDLKVFDLVYRMRDENRSYEDIHASLLAGERGNSPAVSPEEVRAIITGEVERQLSLEINILRKQLSLAEDRLKEFDVLKENNIRLQTELDAEKRRAEEINNQLKAAMDKQEMLLREMGRTYHQGFLEGMKQHDQDSTDS
jgi:DNA-binding transcriptional MerR regulator